MRCWRCALRLCLSLYGGTWQHRQSCICLPARARVCGIPPKTRKAVKSAFPLLTKRLPPKLVSYQIFYIRSRQSTKPTKTYPKHAPPLHYSVCTPAAVCVGVLRGDNQPCTVLSPQVRYLERQLELAQQSSVVEGGAIEVLEGLLRQRDTDKQLVHGLGLKSLEIGLKIGLLETDAGGKTVEVGGSLSVSRELARVSSLPLILLQWHRIDANALLAEETTTSLLTKQRLACR